MPLDTRLGNLSRTGPYVQSLGQFNTLLELTAGHPANNYLPGTMAYTVETGQMISDGTQWLNLGTTIPGEVELKVATYAKARLISGVTTGDILYVLGRTTQSDGGQGLFTWVAGGSTTINDGSQLSAPGGIWQRPDVELRAEWYGIDATGAVACDVALNLAIQDAIAQKKKLVIPTGLFQLANPLICYSGIFSVLYMRGQGGTGFGNGRFNYTYPGSKTNPNTILWANFNDRPALIYNAIRSCVLQDLCILGNNMSDGSGSFSAPYPPQAATTNYVLNGCRNSRYSPQAGICLDPFTCVTPPDGGYPGMTYSQSVGSGSEDFVAERVRISGFVVGVMMNPGTTNANGDDYTFRDVVVDYCNIDYACGDTQARSVVIINGAVEHSRCCFDTLTYGNQNGPIFTVYGTNVESCYSLLNCGVFGTGLISGVYAESLCTLGVYGTAPNANDPPLVFENLSWQLLNILTYPVDTVPGAPPVCLVCSGPVLFLGCRFYYTTHIVEAWNFLCNTSTVAPVFESCHFTGSIEARRIPPIGQQRASSNATLINCYVNGAATGGQSQVVSDNLYRGQNSLSITWGNSINRLTATCQTNRVPDRFAEYAYVAPGSGTFSASSITVTGITAMTLNAGTVTFTKVNAGQFFCEKDLLFWTMLPYPGVAVSANVPALKIPVGGIVGNNVTANMLWDPAYYDTVANQHNAGADVELYINHWAPTDPLTCTTNGTTTLTAVSPTGTLIPGDFVIGAGVNSADIPSTIAGGVRVISNNGAGTVVIGTAAAGSHAGVGLRFGYLSPVTPVIVTVATLPPGIPGLRYMVSDALGPAFGAAVVGGGAVRVPVFADNTGAWIVG